MQHFKRQLATELDCLYQILYQIPNPSIVCIYLLCANLVLWGCTYYWCMGIDVDWIIIMYVCNF